MISLGNIFLPATQAVIGGLRWGKLPGREARGSCEYLGIAGVEGPGQDGAAGREGPPVVRLYFGFLSVPLTKGPPPKACPRARLQTGLGEAWNDGWTEGWVGRWTNGGLMGASNTP